MRNLLRYMPLVCLLVPSLALGAQPRNPYDLEFENLRSQWTWATRLEKLALLDQARRLRDYADDRSQIQRVLETVRQSAAEDALVRNEAAAYLDDLRAFKAPAQPRAHRTNVPARPGPRARRPSRRSCGLQSTRAGAVRRRHTSAAPAAVPAT